MLGQEGAQKVEDSTSLSYRVQLPTVNAAVCSGVLPEKERAREREREREREMYVYPQNTNKLPLLLLSPSLPHTLTVVINGSRICAAHEQGFDASLVSAGCQHSTHTPEEARQPALPTTLLLTSEEY